MWERDEMKKLISGSTGGLRICGDIPGRRRTS